MPFRLQPVRLEGSAGLIPDHLNLVVDAAQAAFEKGRVLRRQADGELELHPLVAVVTDLHSISNEGWTGSDTFGPAKELNAVRINRQTIFAAPLIVAGALVAPGAADFDSITIGQTFGLLVVGSVTGVDKDDTTNVVVEVAGKDKKIGIVFFKFTAASIQAA